MNILEFTQKFQFKANFQTDITISDAASLAAGVSPKDVNITRDFDTIDIKWTTDEVKNKYNSNIENELHAYYITLCEALSDEKIEPVYTDEDNAYFRDKANQLHNEVRRRTMTKRKANEIYYRERDIYILEQNKVGRCLFRCDSITRLFTEIGFDGINDNFFNPVIREISEPATPEEPAEINNDDSKKQPAEKTIKRPIVITPSTLDALWDCLQLNDTPDHWRGWDSVNRMEYGLSEKESLIYFIYDNEGNDSRIPEIKVGQCLGGASREAIQSAHRRAKGKVEMYGNRRR